jgi:hypothetical protein
VFQLSLLLNFLQQINSSCNNIQQIDALNHKTKFKEHKNSFENFNFKIQILFFSEESLQKNRKEEPKKLQQLQTICLLKPLTPI